MFKIDYKRAIYISTLLFAFSLPLSRAAVSLFIILLPIFWILDGNLKEKFNTIVKNKFLLSIILLISYATITILWSNDIKNYLHSLRIFWYLFTIFVISTTIQKEQIEKIISFFLTGMFISEVIAYGVFFRLWDFKHATPQDPSPFMVHIDYSVFLAFTSLLLLYRLFSSIYSLKSKMVFFIFFITVTGNLFLTEGRTGQVAFIFGLIVLSYLHFRLSFKTILVSILLIFSLIFAGYNLSTTFNNRVNQSINSTKRMINNKIFDSSIGIRSMYWPITYHILKEHPFGVGIGEYINAIYQEIDKREQFYKKYAKNTIYFLEKNHPHNQYLLIAIQMGIVGIILFFNLLYQFFKLPINDRNLKHLSVIFGVVYFISCLSEPLLIKQFPLVLFILFSGLFSIKSQEYSKEYF